MQRVLKVVQGIHSVKKKHIRHSIYRKGWSVQVLMVRHFNTLYYNQSVFKFCPRPSQRTAIISLNITNRVDLTIEVVWGLSPVRNKFSYNGIPFRNFRLLRVAAVYHSNNSLQTGDCLSYQYYKFVSISRPCVTSVVTDCRKEMSAWCS
jgi:hypothetical protein